MPVTKKQKKPRSKIKDEKVLIALKDVKALLRQYERATASGHATLAINCADAIIPAVELLKTLAKRSVRERYGNDLKISPKNDNDSDNDEDDDSDDSDCDEENCEGDECEDEDCDCDCHLDDEDEDNDSLQTRI